ncbi:GEVED domain-containing protein [Kaistella pullorum]|uniref:Carbohydrate binding domain-containing protein n=1 Tax=Kaistella pullorum TaxID=2763074 RepID=A0ABR8WJ57_9FLAO|nr:GEVED domain-containing protein [Kaistella pullorum]MBD8017040.1 carbohydrate binding domain-containing protein [Kaistella pullorum]
MPASFNNNPTARIRFYYHNGSGGTTGNRPKIALDNILVTSTGASACDPATLTAGTTNATTTQVASGGSTNLSLTGASTGSGLSYQWQSSPNGATWTNISGATNATYSATNITALTHYRALVTCGATTVESEPIIITVTYCTPTYSTGGTNDKITNVTLGTLNNSASGATSAPFYTFYNTVTIPDITQSQTASVSVTFGSDTNQYGAVWIDFNQNNIFETSEGAVSTNAGANGNYIFNIPVPSGAILGNTRMRIRGGDDSALTTGDACSTKTYGETEDYIVNIVAQGPTVTADAGSLTAFTYVEGSGPSAEQNFTVTGVNLTTTITAVAPTNWEVSSTSGTGFGTTAALPAAGGKIYTRLVEGLPASTSYSGNISLASTGATTVNVTVSGSVTANTPNLVLSGTPLNLGSSCPGTVANTVTYTITNNGGGAASNVVVTSDNTQFVMSNLTATDIAAGDTAMFDVTFTPNAAGAQNATITVSSTGSNSPTLALTGTGNATVNPVVTTQAASALADTGATLNGNVTSLGSCLASALTERGFVYGTASTPELNSGTFAAVGTVATGAYNLALTTLMPATQYYYKSYVKDASGQYVYGAEQTFTTVLNAPAATAATNVTPVGFTANWNAVNGAESYELDVYEKVENISPNLVVNPGFENSTLDPWTFEPGMNQVISNSPVKTGTASLYSTVTATRNFNQDIAVENGKEYKLKFSYYIDPSSTGTGFRVWTTTGATVQLPSSSAYYNTKGSWIDVEHTFTASGSNLTLNLRLYNGVKIYFDDFDLRNSESILTNNYILNATNVGNVTSYEVTGLNPESTYYYVVRAVSGSVTSASSNTIEVTTQGTPTWNGTEWSNTTGPDATTPAIIDGDYEGAAITAQSLTINAGKTLTVNNYVSVGNVTNNGNILVADGANFVQTGTFTAGAGSSFKVRKDTKPVKRLAYVNWSSPMDGSAQTLKEFSFGKKADGTNQSATGTVDGRFFTYNNNVFAVVAPTSTFQSGAGYQIRTPNDFTTTPQVFHGQFEGTTPNTGAISVDHIDIITGDYVLLGNPYPSAISINDFLTANPDTQKTIYIWNSEAEMIDNTYGGGNYNTYAPNTGSVPAGAINGYIPVGQGFFIERGTATAPFVFENSMRRTTEDGVFSKAATADKFWLELTVPSGSKPQMLIGFNAAATADYDAGFDGALFGTNADALYSEVNGTKLVIDAHGTFSSDDTFALKADLSAAGNYTIGILKSEGVFANGQQIWLKDQLTGTTTLISEQPYAFSADAGTLANRFVLQFKPGGALATDSAVKSDIRIYSAGSDVHAKSSENITSLHVYDMSGRMIAKAPAAQKEIVLNVAYKGVVLVKAQLANGTVKTTKLMLK